MDLFAAALGDLLADPHVGMDAEWRAGGAGPPVSVRVVRSSPDRVATAFDAVVIQATDVLTVAVGDVPDLASGDSITIGSDALIVTHAERDAIGVAWRAYCRRQP